jgi:hypothetical protein
MDHKLSVLAQVELDGRYVRLLLPSRLPGHPHAPRPGSRRPGTVGRAA